MMGADVPAGAAVLLVVLAVALCVVAGLAYRLDRRARRAEQLLANELRKPAPERQQIFVQSRVDGEREDRDRLMADLHISKLRVELDLLNRQLASRHSDEDRIEASKEFHELMVEKTKLEIDSMRLHIAELRKRMDDFGV